MLKLRELHEVPVLYELMTHPEVFPYVRQKANTLDELYFLTKQTIEAEQNRELISRTILDEFQQPIGTINLFDIEENYGFLATWIGKPYFGKGYNRQAKDMFFDELFLTQGIDGIFMKVRKTNIRSLKAVLKLPYIALANETYPGVFSKVNPEEEIYDLFVITKENYLSYKQFSHVEAPMTGEVVS
ncbi:GNAT family N-acetyltransferase [Oceanobacillus luteolus]|mgnify:CR=1 FL=1|uniref:GNAT family N-acetyltransferase n=1 Tax=Oceanobacillus luteolus TaxID=1274358 RepID=A0ABW4HPZ3_9BACI|nr:GNAT family N-acetyltransferase [Oceanobacillus luteolus]MCM3739527.1 GNAT family N-acetyltransferase [Oceanobacillus luteolus]